MAGTSIAVLVDQYGRALHGAAAVPRLTTRRLVFSGVPMYGGQTGWDDPIELREPGVRHETYRRMHTSDPHIAEVVRAWGAPLLARAVFDVAPGIEVEADPALMAPYPAPAMTPGVRPGQALSRRPAPGLIRMTPEQQQSALDAELVAANLYCREGDTYGRECWIRGGFLKRLREVLTFLGHGFSLSHRLERVVDGRVRIIDRLTWLEPHTIVRWLWDDANCEILGIERQYLTPSGVFKTETLPADELNCNSFEEVGMRVEGMPIIRPLFGSWKRKEFILRVMCLALQRAGVGIPYASWDPNSGSEDLAQKVEHELQSSLGVGIENAYLAIPNKDFKAGYMQQDPQQLEKFGRMAENENAGIAHGGGTQSGRLGETGAGNRALGETLNVDKYILAEATAQMFGEQELHGCQNMEGNISLLMRRNRSNVARFPYVRVSNIDPQEATRNLPLLQQGVTCGIVRKRPAIEKHYLDAIGIELSDEAYLAQPEVTAAPALPARPDPGVKAASRARSLSLVSSIEDLLRRPSDRVKPAGTGRTPTVFEDKVLALAEISTALSHGDDQLGSVLLRAHRKMVDDLVGRVESGRVTTDSLSTLRKSSPKGASTFEEAIEEQFIAIGGDGQEHAEDELERQRTRKLQVVPPGGEIPKGPVTVQIDDEDVLLAALAALGRKMAAAAVDTIWARLVTEGMAEISRLAREQISAGELARRLEAFLQGLSETPVTRLARRVTTIAYNGGRDVALKNAARDGIARFAFRSELLDKNTCESCARLDGTIAEIGTADYEQLMPPNGCEGDELCRGIPVGLAQDLVEQAAA